MTVEPISSIPEVEAKVVDGALRAIARFGLGKLTVDDVAREAGISRATLYRYFPGRGAVLGAVVRSEADRLRAGLDAALGETTTLAQALEAVARFGAGAFVGHEALQHLLAPEPGAVLPHLCFNGADTLLGFCADRIAPPSAASRGPLKPRGRGGGLARSGRPDGRQHPPAGAPRGPGPAA